MPLWLPQALLTFRGCCSGPIIMPQQLHAACLGDDLLHALFLHIDQVVALCGCLRLGLHTPPSSSKQPPARLLQNADPHAQQLSAASVWGHLRHALLVLYR